MNRGLLLEWGTGLGKSLAAIKCQNQFSAKTLLVVAETSHKKNWISEYDKHNYSTLLDRTKIICYHSLSKEISNEYDMIILDECHRLSSLRASQVKQIRYNKLVCLSATVDNFKNLKFICKDLFIHSVPLQDAIDWGILPPPKIYAIGCYLDDKIKNQDVILRKGTSVKTIYCDYKDRDKYVKSSSFKYMTIKCRMTEVEYYEFINSKINYLNSKLHEASNSIDREKLSNAIKNTQSMRKRFLANSKTRFVKTIIGRKLKTERVLIFTGSIEQSLELSPKHSINSKSKNKQLLDDFNDDKFKHLFAVNMLQEGVSINNLHAVVITQLDNFDRSFIQKLGRAFRNTNPLCFLLYVQGTRDEDYLVKALENIKNEYVTKINMKNVM